MKRSIRIVTLVLLIIATAHHALAQEQKTETRVLNKAQQEPVALGKPLGYWLKVIRDRNTAELGLAYEAIIGMGPAAYAAVPDLTDIVAEPFTPIRLGADDRREILAKLKTIFMKGGAIDALAAIGVDAADSAPAVIEWSLTVRVLPPEPPDVDPLFIDLVAMDVLERMRGAGAVAEFGIDAAPAVQRLMESKDAERRKFVVAILNEASLPLISDLMKSRNCRDRMLGLSVLADMWPVVPGSHLNTLRKILTCSEDDSGIFSAKTASSPTLD